MARTVDDEREQRRLDREQRRVQRERSRQAAARRAQTSRYVTKRPKRSKWRALIPFAVIALLPLIVVAVARIAYHDKILPRTKIGGVEVGGKTRAEAEQAINARADREIDVIADGKPLTFKPAESGYAVDAKATVDKAFDKGRKGGLLAVGATIRQIATGSDVDPIQRIDQTKFDASLRALRRSFGRVPSVGSISADPVDLQVSSSPPEPGRTLSMKDLRTRVAKALGQGKEHVVIPITTVRGPSTGAVNRVARAAEAVLNQPLKVTGDGKTYEISPKRLAPALMLTAGSDQRTVFLDADPKKLAATVASIAQARDRPARDAKLSAAPVAGVLDDKEDTSWRPRTAKVHVRPGRVGHVLDQANSVKQLRAAIRHGRTSFAAVVKSQQPKVTTTGAQKAGHLIGAFTTHYVPGQPRVTNIRLIAKTVDGTVIPPGGQFSLNGIVGERTKAKGYVKAPYIADGELSESFGGGVSQFSTTMYNAAYFAGLQLDSHTPHSFFIDRYPAGRESTLNWGSIELLWTNDTQSPVLIRTSSTPDSVSVSLFGDNGGRRVSAKSSKRTHPPGKDFAVTVTRTIRYGDGHVVKQPYTSTYDTPPAGE